MDDGVRVRRASGLRVLPGVLPQAVRRNGVGRKAGEVAMFKTFADLCRERPGVPKWHVALELALRGWVNNLASGWGPEGQRALKECVRRGLVTIDKDGKGTGIKAVPLEG